MIAIKRDCLDQTELEQVLAGRMPEGEFDSAISHLDNCEDCRAAADALQQDGHWLAASLASSGPDPLHAETACQVALWRMLETPIPAHTTVDDSVPCDRLGPYQLMQALGTGGMGTVYLARHQRLNRDFALKVISDHLAGNWEAVERFGREIQTSGMFIHENIVLATDCTPAEHDRHGPEEQEMELLHVSLDEALAMVDRGEIRDAKTVAGLLMTDRHLRRASTG